MSAGAAADWDRGDGGGYIAVPIAGDDLDEAGECLGDAGIRAVVAVVMCCWPEGARAAQAVLDLGGGEALAAMLQADADWTLPPDCLDVAQRAAARAGQGGTR